ncbi:hypothetical protein EDB48_105149 [Vibrio crassostreae]|nr:hypothetical protein EDB48_105149 [Vibrio crassostreae]
MWKPFYCAELNLSTKESSTYEHQASSNRSTCPLLTQFNHLATAAPHISTLVILNTKIKKGLPKEAFRFILSTSNG